MKIDSGTVGRLVDQVVVAISFIACCAIAFGVIYGSALVVGMIFQ